MLLLMLLLSLLLLSKLYFLTSTNARALLKRLTTEGILNPKLDARASVAQATDSGGATNLSARRTHEPSSATYSGGLLIYSPLDARTSRAQRLTAEGLLIYSPLDARTSRAQRLTAEGLLNFSARRTHEPSSATYSGGAAKFLHSTHARAELSDLQRRGC